MHYATDVQDQANLVARHVKGGAELVEDPTLAAGTVRLVLGKDFGGVVDDTGGVGRLAAASSRRQGRQHHRAATTITDARRRCPGPAARRRDLRLTGHRRSGPHYGCGASRSRPPPAPSTDSALVAAVSAVGVRADQRWREGDELRHLPADLADDLVATRVFQAWVPKDYGGDQLGVAEVLDAIEEASYRDGSFGWCAMIGATTALLVRPPAAGVGRPRSTATRRRAPAGSPCPAGRASAGRAGACW